MDGTLLNSKNELPEDFFGWVEAHPEIVTVIASGRQYQTLCDNMAPMRDKLTFIAENGGFVFHKGERIYCDEMPRENLLRVLHHVARRDNLVPILCGQESAYMPMDTPEDIYGEASVYFHKLKRADLLDENLPQDVIVKVAVYVKEHAGEAMMDYMMELKPQLNVVLSGDRWIDVSNNTVCKGNAIRAIQRIYDIDPLECMCFGDYLNDVTLIESCEESYCMENGHPMLKKLAKHLTSSNDDRGVMRVLERL